MLMLPILGWIAFLAFGGVCGGAEETGDLRVYAAWPAVFEYRFTSVLAGGGEDVRVGLRHADGTTHTVGVGETVGDYTVTSHATRTVEVFKPGLNRRIERDADFVTLEHASGKTFELELGEPLELPGRPVVCLVALDSADWTYARHGDRVTWRYRDVEVEVAENGRVVLADGDTRHVVPRASSKERETLRAAWTRRKARAARLARRRAEERKEETEAERVADILANPQLVRRPVAVERPVSVLAPARGARMFAGTEYRYPTDYEVIPMVGTTKSGDPVFRAVVVPRRFETRTTGMEIYSR